MMNTVPSCCRNTGFTRGVRNSTVCGSMATGVPRALAYTATLEVGPWARCTENTTSAAVKGAPSWNFTPWRSVKRQVVGLVCCQAVARPGTICSVRSRSTRVS